MVQSCITNALLLRLVPPRTAALRAEFAVGVKGVAAIDAVVSSESFQSLVTPQQHYADEHSQGQDAREQPPTA